MRQEHLHMPSDEDGLMLHGLLQLPQGEVRGILHLVHGMCDHKERYQQMLDFFSEQGYALARAGHPSGRPSDEGALRRCALFSLRPQHGFAGRALLCASL